MSSLIPHLSSSQIHSAPTPPNDTNNDPPSIKITIPPAQTQGPPITPSVDYKARSQCLRAAVLGANDGLVSVASLMIGVGAVNDGPKAMLASGLAGLVAGALSMAIGEYVSVYAQYDIEIAAKPKEAPQEDLAGLPRPLQAAAASAFSFAVGALLPLIAGGFIRPWGVRVGAVCAVSSLGLAGFGAAGAVLGGADPRRSAVRVMVGGWLAMLITFGVLRLFGLVFKMQVSSA